MTEQAKILRELERIAPIFPVPFYWLDLNQHYLGVNEPGIKGTGTFSYERDFAGKTPYDLYPYVMADEIVRHHKQVIRTGERLSVEESIRDRTTKEIKYFSAMIVPLHGDDGNIIGTIGTSIDITANKKEAERLNKAKIFSHLQMLAQIFPAPVYWLDTNNAILGVNGLALKGIGFSSYDEIIGKTPYDFYPYELADHIVQHNNEVMRTGKSLSQEETIKDVTTGEIKHFAAVKAPLLDDDGNIIGTMGTSIDITVEKKEAERLKKAKVLEHLEKVAQIIPTPIYWLDANQKYLGVNELVIKASGTESYEKDFAGKTPYDLYPKEMARDIVAHHQEVIQTKKILTAEESIKDITTGEVKYFSATIAPLRDDDGNIIGTIGTSIDITAEKEAEHLKLENELQKAQLREQEKFRKIADQVAHDIRSPLASLLMIVKSCTEIPETERIALREAAIGISDIANNLLGHYKAKEMELSSDNEERQPVLLSATLFQLLTDKKFQYQDLGIRFAHDFSQAGQFAFIQVELTAFKCMVSNLINNAVDALANNKGRVILQLDASLTQVKVTVIDNGKGMSPALIKKIISNIAFTEGKPTGHGIGLTQVRETLQRNQGEMSVHSIVDSGTQITLTFPRIKAPGWIAEEIKLSKQDIVIILDDDVSIHVAWNTRFEPLLRQAPDIKLKHFENCKEAIHFLNSLSAEEKHRVLLLTDFELLKQELNGLHVVEKTQVKRSILVTSHYANPLIRERAVTFGTKILPKQLASEIPIIIDETLNYKPEADQDVALNQVDLLLVDDDRVFAKNLMNFIFDDKEVAYFEDPLRFLESVSSYATETPIYLDNNFATDELKGIEIANSLYQQGYTRLYLLSGESFLDNEIPHYITVIRKNDIDSIKNSLD